MSSGIRVFVIGGTVVVFVRSVLGASGARMVSVGVRGGGFRGRLNFVGYFFFVFCRVRVGFFWVGVSVDVRLFFGRSL